MKFVENEKLLYEIRLQQNLRKFPFEKIWVWTIIWKDRSFRLINTIKSINTGLFIRITTIEKKTREKFLFDG